MVMICCLEFRVGRAVLQSKEDTYVQSPRSMMSFITSLQRLFPIFRYARVSLEACKV